jgi:iron complex transport system permease protein
MGFDAGVMASTHTGAVTVSHPVFTTATAFFLCFAAAGVIIAVSRLQGASPETMILTGVALGALFMAGKMFLQFLQTTFSSPPWYFGLSATWAGPAGPNWA